MKLSLTALLYVTDLKMNQETSERPSHQVDGGFPTCRSQCDPHMVLFLHPALHLFQFGGQVMGSDTAREAELLHLHGAWGVKVVSEAWLGKGQLHCKTDCATITVIEMDGKIDQNII